MTKEEQLAAIKNGEEVRLTTDNNIGVLQTPIEKEKEKDEEAASVEEENKEVADEVSNETTIESSNDASSETTNEEVSKEEPEVDVQQDVGAEIKPDVKIEVPSIELPTDIVTSTVVDPNVGVDGVNAGIAPEVPFTTNDSSASMDVPEISFPDATIPTEPPIASFEQPQQPTADFSFGTNMNFDNTNSINVNSFDNPNSFDNANSFDANNVANDLSGNDYNNVSNESDESGFDLFNSAYDPLNSVKVFPSVVTEQDEADAKKANMQAYERLYDAGPGKQISILRNFSEEAAKWIRAADKSGFVSGEMHDIARKILMKYNGLQEEQNEFTDGSYPLNTEQPNQFDNFNDANDNSNDFGSNGNLFAA